MLVRAPCCFDDDGLFVSVFFCVGFRVLSRRDASGGRERREGESEEGEGGR